MILHDLATGVEMVKFVAHQENDHALRIWTLND
jgi:hypothetical protein